MAITKYFSLKILIFASKYMFHLKYIKIMTTNEMILQTQLIWFSRYLNYKSSNTHPTHSNVGSGTSLFIIYLFISFAGWIVYLFFIHMAVSSDDARIFCA